jgi:hypothetical protein
LKDGWKSKNNSFKGDDQMNKLKWWLRIVGGFICSSGNSLTGQVTVTGQSASGNHQADMAQ